MLMRMQDLLTPMWLMKHVHLIESMPDMLAGKQEAPAPVQRAGDNEDTQPLGSGSAAVDEALKKIKKDLDLVGTKFSSELPTEEPQAGQGWEQANKQASSSHVMLDDLTIRSSSVFFPV